MEGATHTRTKAHARTHTHTHTHTQVEWAKAWDGVETRISKELRDAVANDKGKV